MSGLPSPAQLGRSTTFALAATISITCAGSVRPANAALPSAPGLVLGSVSILGNNTAWESPVLPRRDRFNFQDHYNQLSAPQRSVLGLLSFGSFGLFASFRPLDRRIKRS